MCLFRGLLLPIIFLVFLFPLILFLMLGRGLTMWRNREKTPCNPSGISEEQPTYKDYAAEEPIDPAKIEYIDYEEVKSDDKS